MRVTLSVSVPFEDAAAIQALAAKAGQNVSAFLLGELAPTLEAHKKGESTNAHAKAQTPGSKPGGKPRKARA